MRKIAILIIILQTTLLLNLENGFATSGDNKISTALSQIKVENENRAKKYIRSDYKHWVDADGDGCDTRREVLVRESKVDISMNCLSNSGEWLSVYDDLTLSDARKIDVDHVVSLAEAHRSGAWRWDLEKKSRYANDLDSPWSLRAVSAVSNRFKSDKDPSKYKPTFGICEYTYSVIITKWRWSLSIDSWERKSLINNLKNCDDITFIAEKVIK